MKTFNMAISYFSMTYTYTSFIIYDLVWYSRQQPQRYYYPMLKDMYILYEVHACRLE